MRSKWFTKEYTLSSLELKVPSLIELLTTRMRIDDLLFHWGMILSILSAIVLEILYVFKLGISELSWVVWVHGIFGAILIIGCLAYLIRYWRDEYFVIATGTAFLVDTVFISAIVVTGSAISLNFLGLLPREYLGIIPELHVILIYAWLIISFAINGGVRHTVATIIWSLKNRKKAGIDYILFSDACGRCGKCIEVCPLYESFREDGEAPALKLRKYLKKIHEGSLSLDEKKKIVELMCVCTLCGLCVGVCPYSFRFVDVYRELLEQVNKMYSLPEVVAAIGSH